MAEFAAVAVSIVTVADVRVRATPAEPAWLAAMAVELAAARDFVKTIGTAMRSPSYLLRDGRSDLDCDFSPSTAMFGYRRRTFALTLAFSSGDPC